MRRNVLLALATALTATALTAPPAHALPGKSAEAAATGSQPYASYWYPDTILNWNPATDPDARFNRSTTPLQPRVSDPALKANAGARAGEGRVASLVSFAPTSGNPSQGALDPNYYAFGYWQYVDKLVFWGGSAGEGLILAPNATVIDAAHRNGVKVYGTVFFPPGVYGGELKWVNDFVQKSGESFPVADKLVEVAKYYGFDGWFINQETEGGDAALATSMRDLVKYARAKGPDVDFMWYDAMTENGQVSWQNALTPANDAFLSDPDPVSNSMFLNFWWSAAGLDASRSAAKALGRSEYDLYSGIDTESNGYNTNVSWDALFPPGQPHVTSLGLYRPEWTWKSSTGRDDFYAKDARYWIGANGDPSDTTTTSSWKGLAGYIAESTPVTTKPFVTGFNTGHGDFYNVAGTRVRTGGWNNLSLQDVLPTYRWLVSSSGSKLTPSLDFDDAYEGGSSLRLTGTLDAPNTVRLYESRLPVAEDTKLSVVVKTPKAGATHLKAAVAFTDAPTKWTTLDLGKTRGTGWERKTLDLSRFRGRTIAQIGLRAAAPATVESYDARIGRLAVYDGVVERPAPPVKPVVEGTTDVTPTRKTLRLSWTAAKKGAVHHYDVYRRNPDGTRTYLGATPNTVYYVPRLERVGTEMSTTIEVEAVSTEYGRSPAARTSVAWSNEVPSEINLAFEQPATASSQCAASEGPDKAVNGSTADKWCALTADKWMEVDLGSVKTINRFVVKHAESGGEPATYNTRDFTIQVRDSASDEWTTAVTVTGNTAGTTAHPVTLTGRHVRLTVTTPSQTSDPAARINEFEVWGA
ncbi:endo-beta-N-acetylglucosaminidase [Nonomuraea maritima]|uniref:endo-beta-N-acetylglucosaminidase n=1 Tax=Nonomuraea maritima TaxID=683260 RepID=UPI003723F50F